VAGNKSTIATLKGKTEGFDKVRKDLDNTGKATQRLNRNTTRLGQSSASSGRQFAAQANGLGGLVGAYAGAAANIFAITAAFTALSRAARAEQTLQGIRTLAAGIGESGDAILANLNKITKGQLTFVEAAQNANLALSSGFSGDQINRLTDVSLRASRALGRDLNDAFSRLVRGAAKLEPELLDELGIFARIEPAAQAYAIANGKIASSLSRFEKQQAFVNAVITEGERKFRNINVTIPTAAERIERLGATIQNLLVDIGVFLAQSLAPLADFISNNIGAALSTLGVLASTVASRGIDVLAGALGNVSEKFENAGKRVGAFVTNLSENARASKSSATEALKLINVTGTGTRVENDRLSAIRASAQAGTLSNAQIKEAIPLLEKQAQNARATIEATEKGTKANNLATSSLEKNTVALGSAKKAATGFFASVGTGAEVAARRIGLVASSITGAAASIVGFAGRLVTIISIFTILSSIITNLTGQSKEFNAFLGDITEKFRSLIGFDPKFKQFKDTIGVFAAESLANLEKADSALRDIDEFQLQGKFLGVTVEFTKTKEELVQEVQSAVADALQAAQQTVDSTVKGAGFGLGIGLLVRAIVTRIIVGAGGAIGTLVGGPIGTAAGLAIGTAAGLALEKVFRTSVRIDEDEVKRIKEKFATIFEDFEGNEEQVQALASVIKNLEEGTSQATIQGQLYLKTQAKIAAELLTQETRFLAINTLAQLTGLSALQLSDALGEASKSSDNLFTTFSELPQLRIFDPELIARDLDDITAKIQDLGNESKGFLNYLENKRARAELGTTSGSPTSRAENEQRLAAFNAILEADVAIRQGLNQQNFELFKQFAIIEQINSAIVSNKVSFDEFVDVINQGTNSTDQITSGIQALENSLGRATTLRTSAENEQQRNLTTQSNIREKILEFENQLNDQTNKLEQSERAILQQRIEILLSVQKELGIRDELLRVTLEDIDAAIEATRLRLQSARELSQTQREFLEINEKIRDTFGAEIKAAEKLNGLFDEQGNIAKTNLQFRGNQLQDVFDTFKAGQGLLAQQKEIKNVLQEQGLTTTQIQKVLSLSSSAKAEENETVLKGLGLSDAQLEIVREQIKLTGDQQTQLLAVTSAQQAIEGSIKKTVQESEKLNKSLEKTARQISNKKIIADLQFSVKLQQEQNKLADTRLKNLQKELSFQKQLLQAQEKLDEQEFKRAERKAKEQFDLSKARLQTGLPGLITDRQLARIEIAFAEESLARLRDFNQKQEKAINKQADLDKKQAQADLNITLGKINGDLAVLQEQSKLQDKQLELQADEQKAQLDLLLERARLLDKEREILATFIGEFAAVSKGLDPTSAQGQAVSATARSSFLSAAPASATKVFEASIGVLRDKIDKNTKKQIEDANTIRKTTVDNLAEQAGAAVDSYDTQLELINLKKQAEIDAINDVLESSKSSLDKLKEIADIQNNDVLQGLSKGFGAAIDEIGKSMETLFDSIADGSFKLKDFNETFRSFAFNILEEFRKELLRETLINPAVDFLKESAGSFLSNAFGINMGGIQKGADNAKVIDGALLVTTGTVSSVGGIEETKKALDMTQKQQADVANKAAEATEQQKGFFATIIDGFKAAGTGVVDFFGSIFSALSGSGGGGGIFSFLGAGGLNIGQLFGGKSNAQMGTLAPWQTAASPIISMGPEASGALNMLAAGGLVKRFAGGGNVNYQDRVPALLQPGEFVMKKSAVKAMGAGNMAMMNATGSGGNVVVNITNEGTPQEATASQPMFDGEKYVIDIVTRDLRNNGPIRKSLRGGAA